MLLNRQRWIDFVQSLQSILSHAVDLRDFQWKFSFFDDVDYVYNSNPRFPQPRAEDPTHLADFPFVHNWLRLNPTM